MAELIIENLTKSFASVQAVRDVSLTVRDGEFLTLLGPSGCGKSTTLFAVAGLDKPTTGRIRMGDRVLFDSTSSLAVPPERRDIGLVFQSYALWPHKTVRQNVSFPLEMRRTPKPERAERVDESLRLVEMESYGDRFPFELSGGQQQRVALARALVYRPQLLLLDEPLSNLDAKLRERARVWLRELQSRLGITTIYVTHDQSEAMSLSDRVVVMDNGEISQLGTPREIYDEPATPFVADFIGSSNLIRARMGERCGGEAQVFLPDGTRLRVRAPSEGHTDEVVIAVRPEKLCLTMEPGENTLPASLVATRYLGSIYEHDINYAGGTLRVQTAAPVDPNVAFVEVPIGATRTFLTSN